MSRLVYLTSTATRWFDACNAASERGAFDGCVEAVPQRAITLGLQEILEAAEIHLVVTGAAKAGILKRLLALTEPDSSLPASWLLTHPNVWLWCDAAALA